MYATGTPISLADMLNSLATFAATAGWTVDHNGVYTSGDYWLAVHQGGIYLNYYVPASPAAPQIQLYGATGYAGGSGPTGQANSSPHAPTMYPPPPGPYTAYHFFSTTAGPIYLHMILEYSSNNFMHLHGGALNAVGGATPALYIASSQWSALSGGGSSIDGASGNYVPFSQDGGADGFACGMTLCTVDSVLRWFWAGNTSPGRMVNGVKTGSRTYHTFYREPNTFNQLVPFIPISQYLERLVGGIASYVGDVPDMRWLSIVNNNPKDEVTIGSDTWKLFPVISKQPFGSPTAATGNYAFAFRKSA